MLASILFPTSLMLGTVNRERENVGDISVLAEFPAVDISYLSRFLE
jgi:hypothetical protein